jgi:hypothetical protein
MSREHQSSTLDKCLVHCPDCGALLWLSRDRHKARIDSGGFEIISLECKCGRHLSGIIDPYDDKFLLCE